MKVRQLAMSVVDPVHVSSCGFLPVGHCLLVHSLRSFFKTVVS